MNLERNGFRVRNTKIEDFSNIRDVCLRVYPFAKPWNDIQLESHIRLFPEGQFVIEEIKTSKIVGMSSSLIVSWDDYESSDSWSFFTDKGLFTNHDPINGKTLYGAEIMVDPNYQGNGLGRMVYQARRDLVTSLKLLRIRAGARMRGYSKFADTLTPQKYLKAVHDRVIHDPTLTFQLKEDFKFISLVNNYLENDPESLGFAVIIEWLNVEVNTQAHIDNQIRMQDKIFNSN